MARLAVMRHLLAGPNLALSTTRGTEIKTPWQHVLAATLPIQLHSVSIKEVNYLFPLYLFPNGKLPEADLFAHQDGRRPNLNAAFVREACERWQARFVPAGPVRPGKREFGPECLFHYSYAVFHSPGYRERYAEFLRADFPRLPLTGNWKLFQELVALGARLVDLHAHGGTPDLAVSFPVKGSDEVREARFQPGQTSGTRGVRGRTRPSGEETAPAAGRVWINQEQFFEPVSAAAWEFAIGGYQPAQRWLKDRLGLRLGHEELATYQHLVGALDETVRRMAEIDARIAEHDGWPLA